MTALCNIAVLISFGILGSLLIDVSEGYGAISQGGSLVMQILQSASGLFGIVLIARSAEARAILRASVPLFALAGLAMLSATWSVDPYLTVRRSINLTLSFVLGIALVGHLGSREAVNLVIRCLGFACFISVIAVVVAPGMAIHQADDSFQSVHGGLWRGLMAHKVSLGIFSGLTVALHLFYGRRAYGSSAVWGLFLASAMACLIGSSSATGLTTLIVLAGTLYMLRYFSLRTLLARRRLVAVINIGLLLLAVLIFTGQLDRFATLLGRSADLTGRATYWPHVEAFVKAHGYYLGFGYGAGFRFVGPLIEQAARMRLTEAHNGILELMVWLGHIGMLAVLSMYAWFVIRASRVLTSNQDAVVRVDFFPYALLVTLFLVSYAESIILSFSGVWAMLFSLAIAVLHSREVAEAQFAAEPLVDDVDFDDHDPELAWRM